MADAPCNTCQHYDPIVRGVKIGRHGRCVVKSTYPAVEQKGQVFPPNAVRAEPDTLAQPHVVVGAETVPGCAEYRAHINLKGTRR